MTDDSLIQRMQELAQKAQECDTALAQTAKHLGEQYFMRRGENYGRFTCGHCEREYVVKSNIQQAHGPTYVCKQDETFIVGALPELKEYDLETITAELGEPDEELD